jgi:hypothetical protein
MRRTKTPFAIALFIGVCSGWMASCDDDEAAPPCIAQETRLCACAGRDPGVETCLADGSGFGECNCSSGPREGAAGTANEPEGPASLVGRACTEDAQCGGLTCFTSASNDFLGGGAPNGYCTVDCATDAECAALDNNSQCVVPVPGAQGLCLRTCRSQNPGSVAENKCLGRRDLVCASEAYLGLAAYSESRQAGWCYPQCGSDEDCPGRLCDLARGVCTDTASAGLPLGAACTASGQCSGALCVQVGVGEAFCSAPCVFGERIGCGYGIAPPTGVRGAACLAPQMSGFLSSEGLHDVGFCAPLCSETSECLQADRGWICDQSIDVQTRFNRPGVCDVATPTDGGADGGGDASTPPAPVVVDAG